jgi:hypothetical protein
VDASVFAQELFISQSRAAKHHRDPYSIVKRKLTQRFATVFTPLSEFTVSHPKRSHEGKSEQAFAEGDAVTQIRLRSGQNLTRNSQRQTFSCNLMRHATFNHHIHGIIWNELVIPGKGLGSGVLGITLFRLLTTNLLHSRFHSHKAVLLGALPSQLPAASLSPSYVNQSLFYIRSRHHISEKWILPPTKTR